MVSTVTYSTLSALADPALARWLPLIAILVLLFLLAHKQLLSAHPRRQAFSRVLDIAIFPLLIVFVLVVVARLIEIFG
jgi:L-asparagine transporter-like permease